jgi:hypothetical protein
MAPDVGLGSQGSVERGWGLWLTSVLAVIIAGVFVAGRLAQRLTKRSGLGMDDYMIVAALLSSVVLSLTECQGWLDPYNLVRQSLTSNSCGIWLRKTMENLTRGFPHHCSPMVLRSKQ